MTNDTKPAEQQDGPSALSDGLGLIRFPWLIVHQPEPGGKMITVLAGPDGADYREFALVLADCVRHVASGFKVSTEDVLRWMQREIDRPTTTIEGGTPQ